MAHPEPTLEDTFTPTTATEVALLNRIDELKRRFWEGGRFYNSMDGFPPDPNQQSVAVKVFTPTLVLAGASEASLDLPRGIRIEARMRGPKAFGYAYYVDPLTLASYHPGTEANMMIDLLRKATQSAATLIR